MSTHFYSPNEDNIKEESINNYKHIFKEYYKNYPTLREALEQLYLNCGATKEKANSLINSIIAKAESFANEGKTPLFFEFDGRLLGIIAVADVVKDDSAKAIKELEELGDITDEELDNEIAKGHNYQ